MGFERGARVFAAIDLGASSGRVMAGVVDAETMRLEEVTRFPSATSDGGDYLRWDVASTFEQALHGISQLVRQCNQDGAWLSGIGIDAWGVDYGLLSDGAVNLNDVRHHRRAGVSEGLYDTFASTPQDRYAATGIIDHSINTIQQLAVRVREHDAPIESTPLFIPDLWIHLLTDTVGTDPTIASTSQLLDITTGDWSPALMRELLPVEFQMPPVHMSGSYAGATTPAVMRRIGTDSPIPIFRVAGHDTACAFAFATPAKRGEPTVGLVSSGTWSLAGIAVDSPVLSEPAREAGFTTERGARGALMMRNLSGMWLVQECRRAWSSDATADLTIEAVLAEAEQAPSQPQTFDPADIRLLDPDHMPTCVAELAREAGRTVPTTRGEIVRAILDSLAVAYVDAITTAAALADVTITEIRIVGGGSRIGLLCQATADHAGLPVIAGPTEATAIGNVVMQVWASGLTATLDGAYERIDPDTWTEQRYEPAHTKVISS